MIDSQFGWTPAKNRNPEVGRSLKKGRMTHSQWVMPAGMKSTPPPGTAACTIFSTSWRRRVLGDLELARLPVLVQGDDSQIGDEFAVLVAELNQVGRCTGR